MAHSAKKTPRRIILATRDCFYGARKGEHLRKTVVRNDDNAATIDVLGGSQSVHSANVRLAMTLVNIPNDAHYIDNAVQALPSKDGAHAA